MVLKYHKDGTAPKNDEIFVFGSNTAGIHGAGAAKEAHKNFGAEYGNGFGFAGQSYAIPTKDKSIATLPLNAIQHYVNQFSLFVDENKDLEFWITRIGCGLAGYKDYQIAPMFRHIKENINFPEEWKFYLTNDTTITKV